MRPFRLLVAGHARRLDPTCPNLPIVSFSIVYEQIEDLDQALLDEEVEGIFMERLQAYHYFKDKTEDDNLRVFDTLYTQISYKMALKINTTCAFLQENFCFRRRLENPLIGPLIKQYTKPLKVLFVSFLLFCSRCCYHIYCCP